MSRMVSSTGRGHFTFAPGLAPSVPFFSNFTGSNLSRLRAAMAATQANSADTRMFFLGDSTIEGLGGTGNQLASNAITGSIPVQVAGLVPNSSWQSAFFDHRLNASGLNAYDNRITIDTNCTQTDIGGLGGAAIGSVDPNTDGFHFTPTAAFDTLEVGYDTTGAGGSFTIGYDGLGVSSTISPQLSSGFQISTVTTTLGAHTIDLKNVSQSAGSWIQFMIARNSATRQNLMMNGGLGGAPSSSFISQSNPYKYLSALITLAPHLVVIEGGIVNDIGNGVGTATTQANFTTMVNALLPTTDVILTTGVPWAIGSVAQATQVQYQQTVLSTARALGVPCIDTFGKFGDWATANANGWEFDSPHPNGTGYGIIAAMIASVLNNPGFRAA